LSTLSRNVRFPAKSKSKHVVFQFENFAEVELDFSGLNFIGQAFADELVRVWPLAHPNTRLQITHASHDVAKMLKHVLGRSDLPQATDSVVIVS
jgi:hypothetical protein